MNSNPNDIETVELDEPKRISQIDELSIGDEIVFSRRSLSDEEIESKRPLRVVDGASKTVRSTHSDSLTGAEPYETRLSAIEARGEWEGAVTHCLADAYNTFTGELSEIVDHDSGIIVEVALVATVSDGEEESEAEANEFYTARELVCDGGQVQTASQTEHHVPADDAVIMTGSSELRDQVDVRQCHRCERPTHALDMDSDPRWGGVCDRCHAELVNEYGPVEESSFADEQGRGRTMTDGGVTTDKDGKPVDDRVATLMDRLQEETNAARVLCHYYKSGRIGYWSKTQRVHGTVVDVANEEGYRLDHATTRDGSGYAEFIPMKGDGDNSDDGEPVLMTDGGRDLPETTRECVRCDSDAVPGSRHCGEHSRLMTDGGVSEGDIRVGDVCLDLSQGRPVQVVEALTQNAAEWSNNNGYDLLSNYANERLEAEPSDAVFECVYVGSIQSEPSKTYAFPTSRLVRIEVEAGDEGRRVDERIAVDVLESLFDAALRSGSDETKSTLRNLAQDAFGRDMTSEARELAEVTRRMEQEAEDWVDSQEDEIAEAAFEAHKEDHR